MDVIKVAVDGTSREDIEPPPFGHAPLNVPCKISPFLLTLPETQEVVSDNGNTRITPKRWAQERKPNSCAASWTSSRQGAESE